jgi:hypothetical protein
MIKIIEEYSNAIGIDYGDRKPVSKSIYFLGILIKKTICIIKRDNV